ncbi:MAG: uracil-DNA glycosylase [bacterium]
MSTKKKLTEYLDFVAQQPKGFVYHAPTEKGVTKEKELMLETLKKRYKNCQKCPLAKQGRTQVVFGHGAANTIVMFVGEGPGRDEDLQGKPFVGRSGQLLTKIIEAMQFSRQDVYISNAVKCRPPNNRTPTIEERETCKNLLLLKEIDIIKPKIICTLGSPATMALLGDDIAISKIRGTFCSFKNILVMPTYHPAYLLRNPAEKKTVWEDMKKVMEKLKELTA